MLKELPMRTINREEVLAKVGRVAVLKGGHSSEREVSLISGQTVFNGLQRLGVDALMIDVGSDVIARLQDAKPDLVMNMLHGQGGEDGVMQGLLEIMQLPYTGSGVLASAMAMDKVKSKLVWQQLGLSTSPYYILRPDSNWQAIVSEFGRVVVKPVSGGSSLGIAIVDSAEALLEQFEKSSEFDTHVMAEKYVAGREFSVGVLGEELLPAIQLETKRQFFDFDAKYVDEDTVIICPPRLDEAKLQELNDLVLAAYRSLECSGLARVDVMQDAEGQFYLLELNTVPGMTEHSFVPTAAKAVGISFDDLLVRILEFETREK